MLDVWTNRPTYIYPEVAQLVGGASLRNCTVRVRIPPTGPLYTGCSVTVARGIWDAAERFDSDTLYQICLEWSNRL